MDTAKLKQLLQKELNDRKVYEDAHAALLQLEGLAQNEKEVKDRLAKLKIEVEKADTALNKSYTDLDKIAANAKNTIEEADKNAKAILAGAKEKADDLAKKAANKLKDVEAAIAQKEQELVQVAEKAKLANAEHAKINEALANARANLKGLLG